MLDLTIRVSKGWRLITVPARVTIEPSIEMRVPAIEKAERFGVNIWPATVNEESIER